MNNIKPYKLAQKTKLFYLKNEFLLTIIIYIYYQVECQRKKP